LGEKGLGGEGRGWERRGWEGRGGVGRGGVGVLCSLSPSLSLSLSLLPTGAELMHGVELCTMLLLLCPLLGQPLTRLSIHILR
jgi:hypothetical protein